MSGGSGDDSDSSGRTSGAGEAVVVVDLVLLEIVLERT